MLAAVTALVVPGAAPGGTPVRGLPAARERAVDWAVSQAGHRERGTTNCSARIIRWERAMGLRVPPCREWCGAIVHEAFRRGGIDLSARLIDPHRSYRDAVAGRRGLRRIPIGSVRRGDLLFYRIRPRLLASHLAIVRSRPRNGRVLTVEGNVSHAVRLQQRRLDVPVLAARVVG